MPIALLDRAMKKLGCKFRQAYGMTETSPVQTILQPEDHRLENLDRAFAPAQSAGRPIVEMEIRVVNAEDRELPVGETREILAFDENGFLYILDRKKDMIQSGGENVFSPEVESRLVSHEDVLEAAVIGVPDERWGETIRAVVVLRPGAVRTEAEIIAYCRAHDPFQVSDVGRFCRCAAQSARDNALTPSIYS